MTELAEPYEMSLAAVSKHLKVLENAGLIFASAWRNGALAASRGGSVSEVSEWLEGYRLWDRSPDSLAA